MWKSIPRGWRTEDNAFKLPRDIFFNLIWTSTPSQENYKSRPRNWKNKGLVNRTQKNVGWSLDNSCSLDQENTKVMKSKTDLCGMEGERLSLGNERRWKKYLRCFWAFRKILHFSSVQSLSHVQLYVIPWTTAHQAFLSITNSRSPPKPMST